MRNIHMIYYGGNKMTESKGDDMYGGFKVGY